MMNFTLEFWLDLAPCPPPSSPGLLYSTPYPTNLTTEELSKIAGRCKVPSREHLASRQSREDSPEVWLILLLSLLAVILVVFIIFGILYRWVGWLGCLNNTARTLSGLLISSFWFNRYINQSIDRSINQSIKKMLRVICTKCWFSFSLFNND